jgi:hypothetical protein
MKFARKVRTHAIVQEAGPGHCEDFTVVEFTLKIGRALQDEVLVGRDSELWHGGPPRETDPLVATGIEPVTSPV